MSRLRLASGLLLLVAAMPLARGVDEVRYLLHPALRLPDDAPRFASAAFQAERQARWRAQAPARP